MLFMDNEIKSIFKEFKKTNATPLFVGGCVRDYLSNPNEDIRDIDIEVFNISPNNLKSVLLSFGEVKEVGEKYGIFIFEGKRKYEFSIPRTEEKGNNRKEVKVSLLENASVKEAARRRDFTINAVYLTEGGLVIDPYDGVSDLKNGILRQVDDSSFIEDELRPYRAMQFIARKNLTPTQELINLCKSMKEMQKLLPKERIWEEWKKLLLLGVKPSLGLNFLKEIEWVDFHPQLKELIGCPQDPRWHPEGDVWHHTLLVVDFAVENNYIHDVDKKLVVLLAALAHDLGKPICTFTDSEGRIVSPKHQYQLHIVENFLETIGCPQKHILAVKELVEKHMWHLSIDRDSLQKKTVRRFASQLKEIDFYQYMYLVLADVKGSMADPDTHAIWDIFNLYKEISMNNEVEKLVTGKDLITVGFLQGKRLGEVLNELYELQLDEKIKTKEEGLFYALDKYILKRYCRIREEIAICAISFEVMRTFPNLDTINSVSEKIKEMFSLENNEIYIAEFDIITRPSVCIRFKLEATQSNIKKLEDNKFEFTEKIF